MDEKQKKYLQLQYGMFLHFGVNTFARAAWGDGKFPAAEFNPAKLNTDQWAEVAAEAGMKYGVLTTKHHDGFCLWPSKYTNYSVKNSACKVDVVGKYAESFRKAGLKVGLYYSLWDLNYPDYENDELYAEYMINQLTELLTNYGDIVELWFDGGWDKDNPNKQWFDEIDPANPMDGHRWHWQEVYDTIHKLCPDCMVIQNSSSNRPGEAKYMPVDVVTSEHLEFVFQGKVCKLAKNRTLPLEFCTTLNPDWFQREADYIHPTVEQIAGWRLTADTENANLLLNIGPDKDGLIPEYHREYLVKANELFHEWKALGLKAKR
ncbi:MAG: alpha-L-fucosidase [Lentisphaeria bacterium]|nr:alpha-L-fucosidase [Lentisphaeria bacterium]